MTKLILVRHGAPDEGHPLQPQDPPLNKTGESQAAQIAEQLASEGVGRIVSSPQRRAQNTAAPLAGRLGLAIETMEGLAEVDRYTDRYRSPETIRKENPERWEEFQKSPARFFGQGRRRIPHRGPDGICGHHCGSEGGNDCRVHAWNANQNAIGAYSGFDDRREIHDRALLGHAGGGRDDRRATDRQRQ